MARSERLGLTWHKASGRWLAPLLAGEQGEIDGFVLVWDTQQEANPLDLTAIEQAATETFTVSLASRLENGEERREYLWQGQPIDLLQHLACLPNVEKKSFAAAAGPLPLTALEKEGNTSPVSHALQVGQALLSVNDNGGQGCHRRLASHFTRPVFYLCDRDGDQLVWTRPGDIRPYQNAGYR